MKILDGWDDSAKRHALSKATSKGPSSITIVATTVATANDNIYYFIDFKEKNNVEFGAPSTKVVAKQRAKPVTLFLLMTENTMRLTQNQGRSEVQISGS